MTNFIIVQEDDVRFQSLQKGFNGRWVSNNLKFVYIIFNAQGALDALNDAIINKNIAPGHIKIRSLGNCYENFVYNETTYALIDVSNLTEHAKTEDRGYYLSSGDSNWGAFVRVFKSYGKVLPGGSCYNVGLGGHISGGGCGIMARWDGLVIDWVTGIELVVKESKDSEARLIYVSNESTDPDERDLFWAHLGGGGGNFGIITKYYFKELADSPSGAVQTTFQFDWKDLSINRLATIFDYYYQFATSRDNWKSSVKFMVNHRAAGALQFLLHTGYFNHEERIAAKENHLRIQSILKEFSPFCTTPIVTVGHGAQWGSMETTDFDFYASTQTMNSSGPNRRGKYKSGFMIQKFPMEQIEKIFKHLNTVPSGLSDSDMKSSLIQVDCFGGQINEIDPAATATPHRRHVWKLQYQTYWTDPSKDALHLKWIRDFYDDMYSPYGGVPNPLHKSGIFEGCYYNYPDVDLNDKVGHDGALYLYFMDNIERLVKTKKRWDADNYFSHEQSIPLTYDLKTVKSKLSGFD